jgi:hypothetical protein
MKRAALRPPCRSSGDLQRRSAEERSPPSPAAGSPATRLLSSSPCEPLFRPLARPFHPPESRKSQPGDSCGRVDDHPAQQGLDCLLFSLRARRY